MNFGLSFTNPWALLIWPPLAIYFVWLSRRTLADLSLFRRRLSLAMRLLVSALIVLAIAGTQLVRYNRDLAIMFVVDYSDSVAPDAKERAAKYIETSIKSRQAGDKWGVVVFGRDAVIELEPSVARSMEKIRSVVPTEFTDISAAIRLAIASLPDGMQKRLVVLSDGNENLGDAVTEARVAQNNEVAIDVVPLASPQRHEVLLEKLTLPNEAKIGEPLEIKAIARATQDADAQIKLFRDGKYLGTKNVRLSRGKNVLVFPQSVEEAGSATFEAQIEAERGMDTVAENNRGLGLCQRAGQAARAAGGNDSVQGKFLADALKARKVNVETRGPGGCPASASDAALRCHHSRQCAGMGLIEYSDASRCKATCAIWVRLGDDRRRKVLRAGRLSRHTGRRNAARHDGHPQHAVHPGGAVAMIMHSMEFANGNEWAKSICTQVTRQLGR
jgi:hypothetical protein